MLRYQEQQRSYIGGRGDPLNHPLTQQQPDPCTYAQTLYNQCMRMGRAAPHLHVCDTLFRSDRRGGEVNCRDCIQHDTLDHFKNFPNGFTSPETLIYNYFPFLMLCFVAQRCDFFLSAVNMFLPRCWCSPLFVTLHCSYIHSTQGLL